MQADTLRLILIVLGAFFLLGIYLWDKRKTRRKAAPRRQEVAAAPEREPTLGPLLEELEAPEPQVPAARSRAEEDLADLPPLIVEQPDLPPVEKKPKARRSPFPWRRSRGEPQEDMLSAATEKDTVEHYQKEGAEVPVLIVQINIAAKQGRFNGEALASAAAEAGLELGAMDIFHHYDQAGGARRVLFSMASMVEPGTFPVDDMAAFSTPGLSLFAKLPGPRDGHLLYDAMLSAARLMAQKLGGELQDETRSVLTRQRIEHVHSEIAEHRRQVALAKKHA
jgi:cell division protein ZipA